MNVIHISGSPGSGKTTWGKNYQIEGGVVVVDTDDLITEKDEIFLSLQKGINDVEYAEIWEKLFTKRLNQAHFDAEANDTVMLIFTGILNHHSPGMILEMPFHCHRKYFLAVPQDQLLRQFYKRYASLEDDSAFWKQVVFGTSTIPSSNEILASSKKEMDWHLTHGYRLLDAESIGKKITKFFEED